jgi:hypothetical protein
MRKSSRRPVVADVRQSIRRKRQCAFRIKAECGPLFLHSSHQNPGLIRSSLIRSTPALPASSFTSLKIDPTKAKSNRVSQLPAGSPPASHLSRTLDMRLAPRSAMVWCPPC